MSYTSPPDETLGPLTRAALKHLPGTARARLREMALGLHDAGWTDPDIAAVVSRYCSDEILTDSDCHAAIAEEPVGEPGEDTDGADWAGHLAAIPAYPLPSIPGPLRALVHAGTQTGLPAPYVAAGGLAALAYVARNCRTVVSDTWIEAPALWLVALGAAGSAKSPGWRYGWGPIWALEHDVRDRWEAEMATWRAVPVSERGESPMLTTHVMSDATPEALIRRLAAAGPQVIVVDELRGWLGGLGRYGSGGTSEREIGLYLGCWDAGAPVGYDRVGGGVSLVAREPAVSVIGTLQSEDHRLLGGVASGFRARWLLHLGPVGTVPAPTGREPDGSGLSEWETTLRQLAADPPAYRLRLASEARQRWQDARDGWRADTAGAPPGLRAALLKADRQALRAATCLAVSLGAQDEIPGEAMTGAVAIVGYALDCWLAIPEGEELTLSRTEERLSPAVDRLAEWLEQRPGRQARREQILRSSVAGVRTAAALDALLDRYEAVYPGSVREGASTGGRRPVIVHAPTRTRGGLSSQAKKVPGAFRDQGSAQSLENTGSTKEVAKEVSQAKKVPQAKEVRPAEGALEPPPDPHGGRIEELG